MTARKIKTLLIEDSGFMRIFIADILRSDSRIEVVATANNGLDGVEKAKAHKPDVVITDMVMPAYDGLYVVKRLMKEMPVPIILLSSLDRADPQIFEALKEGAFDFLDKPQDNQGKHGYPHLTELIREASLSDYVNLDQPKKTTNTFEHTFDASLQYDIIAIGASTGGPGAVEYIVNNLPKNLAIPVIIAQHMPERFIESFATRLNDTTGLNVSVVARGETLLPNRVYLAPGTSNIRIIRDVSAKPIISFVKQEYKEFNQPSIDCLFESVAEVYGNRAIGIILTGMGKDGAEGLKRIKEKGGFTLAQDEASSVVYGMPKVAYETGAATYQMSIKEIPRFVITSL
jgi:two-component system, chemotaxis family, protein-glutamate methylesterase/glutaminase